MSLECFRAPVPFWCGHTIHFRLAQTHTQFTLHTDVSEERAASSSLMTGLDVLGGTCMFTQLKNECVYDI
jgi:hypothetical protein